MDPHVDLDLNCSAELPTGVKLSGCVVGIAVEDVDKLHIGLWLAVIEVFGGPQGQSIGGQRFEVPRLLTQALSRDLVLPGPVRPAIALIDRIVSKLPGGVPTFDSNIPLQPSNKNCLIRKKVRTADFQGTFASVREQAEKIVFGLASGSDQLFKDAAAGYQEFSLHERTRHPLNEVDCFMFSELSKLTNLVVNELSRDRHSEVKKTVKFK